MDPTISALSRLALPATGLAVLAAVVLGAAAPASALTTDVTYVTAADFTVGTTYTAIVPGWHFSKVAPTSGLTGVTFPTNDVYAIGFPAGTGGSSFQDIADGVDFGTANPLTSGTFQIAMYFETAPGVNGALIYTTNTPDGSADPSAQWLTQGTAVGGLGGNHTLGEFDAAAAANEPDFAVTGWGFYTGLTTPLVVTDLLVNGTQYIFTPEPVVTTAPAASIPVATATSTGVTVTTSGFLPGETIDAGVGNGGTGGSVGTTVADAAGVATFSYVFPAGTQAGNYTLALVGSVPNPQFFAFAITAPAAAVPAAVLAATGTESFAPLAAGGVLMLGGAALAMVAMKKRRTA